MVARVILNNREQNVDKTFDYEIPSELEESVQVGVRVGVPFGNGNRCVNGIVVGILENSEFKNLKKIKRVLSGGRVCEPWIVELCLWISKKYYCSFYQALRPALLPGMESGVKEKSVSVASLLLGRDEAFEAAKQLREKNATVQARIIEALIMADRMQTAKLIREKGGSYEAIRALEKKGFIEIEKESVERHVYDEEKIERTRKYEPTPEQKTVIEHIYGSIESGKNEEILLRGVTGSGKTEVFLQAIERVIEKGKNAIVLVPEIALTPQMVQRFVGRFGNSVAVMHSALSSGERYDQWNKIRNNEVRVVVGARSAIFAPFTNIGIIILDEEHETSYKSETSPRYHAKEVAARRARTEGCTLLLASATPLVADYYKAKSGEYTLLEMKKRYNEGEMPEVKIVDMRGELFNNKNYSPISLCLQHEIGRNLMSGQKTILFLNRRGFSTFVSCRECGEVMECPDCGIALTYHKNKDLLTCHYCGYTIKNVQVCPGCGSKYVKYFGTGTQKIEAELARIFPDARVLRMDTDTTSKKGGHELILDKFARGEADILLGTQMVTKGLDFHEVTLVGVLAADTSLAVDDFRANERSFSLFTQVSGRAGRGSKKGRAIIQTYQPQNTTIKFSTTHNYEDFYENEIVQRKRLNYPPFCDIICIIVSGEDEKAVSERINSFAARLKELCGSESGIMQTVGPAAAPIAKIRGVYRYRLLIKCRSARALHGALSAAYEEYEKGKSAQNIVIDVNPVNLY